MELTKLHYTCSIKSFQREVLRRKVNFFINLEYWLNSSSVSGIFFPLDCQICKLRVCRKSMEKKLFETCKLFHEIRTLSKKLSAFGRHFSERIGKTAFYVLLGTIRGKQFFECCYTLSDMESKSIGFFRFFFGGFLKTTIYISRGTVRWKTTIRKTYYGLIIFGQWVKSFWPSGNFFSIELSKLLAMCP